jgi:pimeloyl-ACP methyl ester carboxylesterase
MTLRRKRFELTVFGAERHRLLVGEDIGHEGSADLFLCLPGLLETRRSFEDFISHVGPHARIMTIDWCGRGDSDRLESAHDYRMSTYLADLSPVYAHAMGAISSIPGFSSGGTSAPATETRRPRIHLVGTSMGGLLAVAIACHKPRHLGTLILNDIGPYLPWSGVFSLMTGIKSARVDDLVNAVDQTETDLAQRLGVDPALLRAVRQPSHLDLPHKTGFAGVDFSASFAAATAPMLLLRGKDSEIINDSVVQRIFEIHPLTRIHECPSSGHPVAYSADVCAAIMRFTAAH